MSDAVQTIAILGSTGSIGKSTLDVVNRHPDRYRIVALTAHTNVELLAEQCRQYRPMVVAVGSAAAADRLRSLLRLDGLSAIDILHGPQALVDIAASRDTTAVMAAIVGAAGLAPALAAARAGKKILLANKEALVMSGQLMMDAVAAHGATLLPIDSEHNAIFQSLPPAFTGGLAASGVRRIQLTASGGPFLHRSLASLDGVTPEEAVAHPNWVMGRKISVDSATMMNKGLEVIEARWLFDATPEQIEVVIHPQSVIHSMVSYIDGSTIAQLGNPDMRTPIAHALAYPERIESGVAPLDLCAVGRLEFFQPDMSRFACLKLAYDALSAGGSAATTLNAANEVAVQAFLDRRIGFRDIDRLNAIALERIPVVEMPDIDAVIEQDVQARRLIIDQLH